MPTFYSPFGKPGLSLEEKSVSTEKTALKSTVKGIVFRIKLLHQLIVATTTENICASFCFMSISLISYINLLKVTFSSIVSRLALLQGFLKDLSLIDLVN